MLAYSLDGDALMMPLIPDRRSCLTAAAALLMVGVAPRAARAATAGSGRPATETRAPGAFSAIAMRGDIDVRVRQGARESVQVTADDNLVPLVETVLDGETLHIQWKRGATVRPHSKVMVVVDVVRLGGLSAAGSGALVVEALKTPALALSIAGSSNATLRQLEADGLFKVGIAGSGDVQAQGRAGRLDVSIAGSGDVNARDLMADDASISIAGSGDADVSARKTVSVTIAGSGDVRFGGGATLEASRVMGSGSVRRRP
jgi:hypothetical protein